MTIVGLVGGLGPESTVDYYRRILESWQQQEPSSAPSIVIDSLDVQRGLRLVASDLPSLTDYLLASLQRLASAGVDFAAMTANTPHIVFDELAVRSPVLLMSIVEVCAQEARQRGLRRLGLLGTRFTMEAPFYPAVCARHGIDVVRPNEDERGWIHERYVGELLKGKFRDETRERIVSVVKRLRDQERIDGVILGGTELPLLLRAPTIADVPLLDTTALHVAAIVRRLRDSSHTGTDRKPPEHALIRPYRENDAADLRNLVVALQETERRIDERLRPGESMASEYVAEMIAQCAEHAGSILVAEADAALAGFVTVLARVPFESLDDPPGEYAFVSDLYVTGRYRRRGLGVRLLDEAERVALSAGARELRVCALHENHPAAALYRRAGFAPYLDTFAKRLQQSLASP